MAKEKILLAYSGDSTLLLLFLVKENYDCDVIAMAGRSRHWR